MADSLAHRGPDDRGTAELRSASGTPAGTFGHHRLAIIDTTRAGHQPMTTADGRYTIAFNGEIYNYRTLRENLLASGARFQSNSDTEVILHGWSREGPAFVQRLRGMLAFALWDQAKNTGYLVRDPFGIKPLYWTVQSTAVLFASEVRAMLESGRIERHISPAAIQSYLATGSVAEPLTIVQGVEALPPGTIAEILVHGSDVSVKSLRRYVAEPGQAEKTVAVGDRGDGVRLVREALRDSVEHHLVSDVPVGLFLSGGIDSSTIAAVASESTQAPLDSFTITFAEQEHNEALPARIAARHFGTRHHEVPLRAADCLAAIRHAFSAMDQPTIDGLNTFFISRAVRERGIKVALSGVGGDELFAGYPSFLRARRAAALQRLMPSAIRRGATAIARKCGPRGEKLAALVAASSPAAGAYEASRMLFGQRQRRSLLHSNGDSAGPELPGHLSLLQQVSMYEMTGYMRNTLLRDTDTFSMAHGLEVRVPFVDPALVRAAFALNDSDKLDGKRAKPILVDAVRDLLPRAVWDRPKKGFALPFQRWLYSEMRAEVDGIFRSRDALHNVGLDPMAVHEVWHDFLAGRSGIRWTRPWALYALARWAAEHSMTWPREGDPEVLTQRPIEAAYAI